MMCHYVAKGPTGKRGLDVPHHAVLATCNEAALQTDRQIDFAVFYDWEALVRCEPAWTRVTAFILPPFVHVSNGRWWLDTEHQVECMLPPSSVIMFQTIKCDVDEQSQRRAFEESKKTGHAVVHTTSLFGLSALSLLGVTSVKCFGFDIEESGHPVYRKINQGMRDAAPLFLEYFDCEISFY